MFICNCCCISIFLVKIFRHFPLQKTVIVSLTVQSFYVLLFDNLCCRKANEADFCGWDRAKRKYFFFNLDLFGEEAEYVSHFRKRGLYLWQEIANLAYSQKLMVLSHSTTLHNRIIWCLSKQLIDVCIQCNVSQTSSTLDLSQRFENTRKFICIYTNMDTKFMVHGIYEWKMLKYHFKQNSIKIKAAIEFQNYVIPIRSKLTHGASTTSFSLRIHWIHFNCSYSPLALIFFGWKCERFRLRATSS